MSKRSPTSLEVKLHAVQRCLGHKSNPNYEAKQLGVSKGTVTDWIRKYKADGLEGLKESKTWKTYSKKAKLAAIKELLSGHYSLSAVTKKYHISSTSVLRNWISKYTSEIELKPTRKGKGLSHMNNGRKTSFEERIEIAQYTIANDLDYQKAIAKYDVSYQQVYAWVRKYQGGSEDALKDNRGRKKPVEELDEHERLKLRIKQLEARNEYLEMENSFAKKLAQIKQRNTR
ncbi:helix-turn-helix domain-containing protein [Paenibacillus sp. IHBB 10380]|uniref:helix-turn-helix domain-containing protein n=1 Tax=Paenibacillus sp. IHBB 10380 TaxID=1566358 RepID=UPI0005CF9A19|nr:helix-turn-helix domain-containing protein [Paenibacillus sp. IHBB 10380]AJS57612.1 transposase [Paenibacillus sp. IHBB 10380]AJS58768.1 transposase [Paenibacillus sp. IHBB 10380]AJS59366.1 transposase [Paenibacillus sp. IHBB 10380]AJS60534.1 transposase [Paenibacillus sp. IHBB 10380]